MAKRIKSFDDIVGHKNLISFLKKKISEDNIPDVVMFDGPSGVGKSSIAKLLAVEITTHDDPALREEYIRAVIDENKSTDSIKLFQMSQIKDKEEEIQRVKAEMNLAFSATKRKVLILDEAHGMSKMAQDSILVELEHLPKGIYVFICSTKIETLQHALKTRGKAKFILNNLSDAEARSIAKQAIEDKRLTFNMNTNMVIATVCRWADNCPREIINFFDNFADGSCVTSKELEVFINMTSVSVVIELMKYLYGSMTLGLSYLESVRVNSSFIDMLFEVAKVVLGQTSDKISRQDNLYIQEFIVGKDEMKFIQFTAAVAGMTYPSRHKVMSAFIKAHANYKEGQRPDTMNTTKGDDMQVLMENIESTRVSVTNKQVNTIPTIEEMFASADIIV